MHSDPSFLTPFGQFSSPLFSSIRRRINPRDCFAKLINEHLKAFVSHLYSLICNTILCLLLILSRATQIYGLGIDLRVNCAL
jgi:hypothetical protein